MGRRTEPNTEESGEAARRIGWSELSVKRSPPFPSPLAWLPSRSLACEPGLSGSPIGWAPLVTERVGLERKLKAARV